MCLLLITQVTSDYAATLSVLQEGGVSGTLRLLVGPMGMKPQHAYRIIGSKGVILFESHAELSRVTVMGADGRLIRQLSEPSPPPRTDPSNTFALTCLYFS